MGLDTASYANTSFRISADLATGNVEVSIGMLTEVDTLIDIENVTAVPRETGSAAMRRTMCCGAWTEWMA